VNELADGGYQAPEVSPDGKHICAFCPKGFANLAGALRHFRTASCEGFQFSQVQIGIAVARRRALTEVERHRRTQSFRCEYCGVQIKDVYKLRIHLGREHGVQKSAKELEQQHGLQG
jgi:hypothetical protein